MNKKFFKLSTLAFTVAAMLNAPAFAEDRIEFIDNKDGTITHIPSGLIWQKCSVGQKWEAGSDFEGLDFCSGNPRKQNYDTALNLTSDFAGQTDWRIPNIRELLSLVDFDKANPAINNTLFPKTPTDVRFWSASIYPNHTDYAWDVNFNNGYVGYSSKIYGGSSILRLVRGGQSFSFFPLDTPTTDFVNNKDGTVTHKKTGLTWQRCAVGQTWIAEEGYCKDTAKQFTHTEAKSLTSDFAGKIDWRLPSVKELETITDYTISNPAINTKVFPDAPNARFWTSTYSASTEAGDKNKVWLLDFSNSQLLFENITAKYAVRLVRGTLTYNDSGTTAENKPATGSVDLTAKLSATPTPAKMGGDLTYTATISNKGKATATNATVTFYIAPNFMTFKNASAGCETTRLSVICNVGDLAAGGSTTKTMTVNLKKAGGISSSVLVKSNEQDANPADNVGKVATGVKK